MNWNIFYLINQDYLNGLGLGAVYASIFGILLFAIKVLLDDIKEGND